jgi:hypothetical protein
MRTSLAPWIAIALLAGPAAAKGARHTKSRYEAPPDATSLPAYRYGTMSSAECLAELDARQIPYMKESARGVKTPVRLTGPLHGVTFHAEVEERDRPTTPYEIADCALVLAIDDFAALLSQHDIVEVQHYSMWRPPGESWPEDRIATRHPGAVAIDAARFIKSDGTKLSVLGDYHGAIGDPTCTPDAKPRVETKESLELRAILCEAVAKHLFNVVLTPNFNKPHRNHFHLEVTSGVRWFLVD